MSDDQQNDQEQRENDSSEVEGHKRVHTHEPSEEAARQDDDDSPDVEGHQRRPVH